LPDAPPTIGTVAIGGQASVVVSSSELVVVTDDTYELKLIDVHDPTHPQVVGTYVLQEVAPGVAASSHYAYVPVPGWGIGVFDIQDPAHPQHLGTAAEVLWPGRLVAEHPWVYVDDQDEGWAVVDASDPYNPHVVWTYPDGGNALALRGDLLYATGGDQELRVFDVTDPLAPVLRGEVDLPGAVVDLTVDGDVLFAPGEGLHVFDLSDPEAPVFIVTLQSDGWPTAVAVSARRVYQAAEFGGLQVFLRHCPQDPEAVGEPAGSSAGLLQELRVQPNPFARRTSVRFDLAEPSTAELTVFDAAGRRLATLVQGERPAGSHVTIWDGRDASGRTAPAGTYFLRLTVGETTRTSRAVRVE
jgi:hypothetical protein